MKCFAVLIRYLHLSNNSLAIYIFAIDEDALPSPPDEAPSPPDLSPEDCAAEAGTLLHAGIVHN